jgi:hypothetical protein
VGAQGQAVINFGSSMTDTANIAITGQAGILSTSLCEAWIDATVAAGTVDHTQDEHSMAVSSVGISCTAIVAGTGFTIVAACGPNGPVRGQFNVAWVWN